ncbi:MAG: shikimate kinase AroL [Proteobacteria bacterium]|nr:shikimate kinase AroL [Pseudomonadota bacterium]MBU1593976.1 shikimate kinase AroL [Pseudomonadota bacterium]
MSGEANIYLIGARACGKTTLGRRLAARLKRPFVDTDQRIALSTGKTVAEIVDAGGWEAFRAAETLALSAVAVFSGQVVSCGGGMVLSQENRDMLLGGRVFYLQASAELLAERLENSPVHHQRPSLTGADIVAEVRQVLAEREPLYLSCAQVVLRADQPLEALVEQALAEVARLEGRG